MHLSATTTSSLQSEKKHGSVLMSSQREEEDGGMQKVAGPKGNRWGEKWNRVRSFISLTTIQKWLHIRYQAICTANRTASWFFYSLDAPSFRILEWDGLSSSTSSISVTIALLSFQFCLFLLLSLKIDVESDMRRTLRGNRKSRILSEAKWEKKRWNLLVMVGRIRRRDLLFYLKKIQAQIEMETWAFFFRPSSPLLSPSMTTK